MGCGLVAVVAGVIWLLTALTWIATGTFVVFFGLAGLGYVLLLVALVRSLRNRGRSEHLLEYGRRRWPE